MWRGKTICVNSPVGESECNGGADSVIRRVEISVRTFTSHTASKTKTKIDMNSAFAIWVIRWPGAILAKWTKGQD